MDKRDKLFPYRKELPNEADVLIFGAIDSQQIPAVLNQYLNMHGSDVKGFDNCLEITHQDGTKSFSMKRHISASDKKASEEEIIVVDIIGQKIAGMGSIYRVDPMNCPPGELNAPLIDRIDTVDEFEGLGLAKRRYILMNQLCLKYFGEPLNSAGRFEHDATPYIWTEFIKEGLAESFICESGEECFRFKKSL